MKLFFYKCIFKCKAIKNYNLIQREKYTGSKFIFIQHNMRHIWDSFDCHWLAEKHELVDHIYFDLNTIHTSLIFASYEKRHFRHGRIQRIIARIIVNILCVCFDNIFTCFTSCEDHRTV